MPADQLELKHYLAAGGMLTKVAPVEQPATTIDDQILDAPAVALPDSFGAWHQARQRRVVPRLTFDMPPGDVATIEQPPAKTAFAKDTATE
ncbi:MAG TPA: hypothetical protein VNT30_12550 [Stellaceae bacterium]|nr:hypothetical protein [Stellaceae bacterium]